MLKADVYVLLRRRGAGAPAPHMCCNSYNAFDNQRLTHIKGALCRRASGPRLEPRGCAPSQRELNLVHQGYASTAEFGSRSKFRNTVVHIFHQTVICQGEGKKHATTKLQGDLQRLLQGLAGTSDWLMMKKDWFAIMSHSEVPATSPGKSLAT